MSEKMNAKTEFVDFVAQCPPVRCACVYRGDYFDSDSDRAAATSLLNLGYIPSDYTMFLDSLDFTYDSGYGGQELFGTIWFVDGSWAERGEYDGAEWWAYKQCPEIPAELAKTRVNKIADLIADA